MNEPHWIGRKECVIIHEMLLARHGGSAVIRDEAALEAALTAPRTSFAAGCANLGELAGCYAVRIITTHPFETGNICTGFLVAATFLRANGLLFVGRDGSVVEETLALAQGRSSEAFYVMYLKCNTQRR
jgi:prophage maintenance system killer protein